VLFSSLPTRWLLLASLPALLGSCVTSKRYNELQAHAQTEVQAREAAEKQVRLGRADLQKANAALAELRLDQQRLAADTTQQGQSLRRSAGRNAQLQESYDRLLKNSDRALADRNADNGKLTKDLATREAELGALDVNLRKSKADNDRLAADLSTREAKLAELTQALADKDKAVTDLKARVTQALLAFNGNDLQVKLKDGKVYVSLSEQLLFKSGSTQVDPKGQEALKKLAAVLNEQPDVNVLVEGHTDNVPIRGVVNGARDNWDLSALRATEIARLLATGGVEPGRITAAGRSQFVPVAANDSPQNKALNRRTEIILTPKLDQLFQLLGTNGSSPAEPEK